MPTCGSTTPTRFRGRTCEVVIVIVMLLVVVCVFGVGTKVQGNERTLPQWLGCALMWVSQSVQVLHLPPQPLSLH